MSLSPVKFEEALKSLLEQRAFLLLVQLARKWLLENMLSERATILYSKALLELCCLVEAESVLHNQNSSEACAVLVEIALRRESWDIALERIARLRTVNENHPRLSEFVSLARVAKRHDPQRLIRSHVLEQRLKGIEIMLCRGMRQQARVCLEHWKKDLPNHKRIFELYCSSIGDLDFVGEWEDLLISVFDQTYEDDSTNKIPLVQSSVQKDSEDTDDTLQITDPIVEHTDVSIKLSQDVFDTTEGVLLLGGRAKEDETKTLSEIILDHENVVFLNDDLGSDPQIQLQKEVVIQSSKRISKQKSKKIILGLSILGVMVLFAIGITQLMLEYSRNEIEHKLEEAVLSADVRKMQERRQIFRYQISQSSFIKDEREAAISVLCAVIWYDFTQAQEDLECAERENTDKTKKKIVSILIALREGDDKQAQEEAMTLQTSNRIALWVSREVQALTGRLEQSDRREARFLIQDMQHGYSLLETPDVMVPWIALETLERGWADFSVQQKEEKLEYILQPTISHQLGKRQQSRLLLLKSLFEMERGNAHKSKLYRLEALERDPENPQLRYWLGWDFYEEGSLEDASSSWDACLDSDVECAMSKLMVLIDMDQLVQVQEMIDTVEVIQSRKVLLSRWLEWAQEDIPSLEHPVFSDLLYFNERWRGVFIDVQKERDAFQSKKKSIQDISWRGLFFISLHFAEKNTNTARKLMSMAIQTQGEATSFVRVLGWMNKREGVDSTDLWKLYLLKNPTGMVADKVQKELE